MHKVFSRALFGSQNPVNLEALQYRLVQLVYGAGVYVAYPEFFQQSDRAKFSPMATITRSTFFSGSTLSEISSVESIMYAVDI